LFGQGVLGEDSQEALSSEKTGMFEIDFPYVVEPMTWGDVSQVMAIEREAFPLPWPERAYRYELSQNKNSHYFVVRPRPAPPPQGQWERLKRLLWREPRPPVLGYGGFWMIAGEAHVSTLAVAPAWYRRGLGELLLWSMLKQATLMGACEATLEVRVSNHEAQNLYLKYGFEKVGRRRRYYQDNGEDAWIMTVADFVGEDYQVHLRQLGQVLSEKLWREKAGAQA
jgi:ribosomal-protein-alanine N-acetyltransferase